MPVLLVVDDEPSILHAFRRVFREPEVTLLTAGSGMEGVKLATTHRPDVVILDVELPDLSGLDAFRLPPYTRVRSPYPGDLHYRAWDHGNGHRSDQAGSTRLSFQAAGVGGAPGTRFPCAGDQPSHPSAARRGGG